MVNNFYGTIAYRMLVLTIDIYYKMKLFIHFTLWGDFDFIIEASLKIPNQEM